VRFITPVADLPVGENLQDHPFVLLNYLTDEETLLTAASEETFACSVRSNVAR
jgi:choline dehydrogenase